MSSHFDPRRSTQRFHWSGNDSSPSCLPLGVERQFDCLKMNLDPSSKTMAISKSLETHFSINAVMLRIDVQKSSGNQSTELKRGWALRTIREKNRNDEEARVVIRQYFKKKRDLKQKCNPHEALMHMKTMKQPGTGILFISPKNRLTISQVKSIINGLLKQEYEKKNKIVSKQVIGNAEDDVEEDEDEEESDDEAEIEELVKDSDIFLKDGEKGDDDDEEMEIDVDRDAEKNADSDSGPLAKLRRRK